MWCNRCLVSLLNLYLGDLSLIFSHSRSMADRENRERKKEGRKQSISLSLSLYLYCMKRSYSRFFLLLLFSGKWSMYSRKKVTNQKEYSKSIRWKYWLLLALRHSLIYNQPNRRSDFSSYSNWINLPSQRQTGFFHSNFAREENGICVQKNDKRESHVNLKITTIVRFALFRVDRGTMVNKAKTATNMFFFESHSHRRMSL